MNRKLSIIFYLTVIVGTAGCSSAGRFYLLPEPGYRGTFYLSPEFRATSIRRVMVMPFKNETGYRNIEGDVADIFILELQKMLKFEVVPSNREAEKLLGRTDLITNGVFNRADMARIGDRFKVDALIFGSILQYRPYEPLALGLKVQMVSTDTGAVVWAVEQIFDSSEHSVYRAAKAYYSGLNKRSLAQYGRRTVLVSMEQYTKFVCSQIVKTLNFPVDEDRQGEEKESNERSQKNIP